MNGTKKIASSTGSEIIKLHLINAIGSIRQTQHWSDQLEYTDVTIEDYDRFQSLLKEAKNRLIEAYNIHSAAYPIAERQILESKTPLT